MQENYQGVGIQMKTTTTKTEAFTPKTEAFINIERL
nr:hypothetical protein [uncultured archaeon]